MLKKRWISLFLFLIVPGLLFTVSCAKKAVKSELGMSQAQEDEAARQARLEAEKARQDALKQEQEAAVRSIEEQRLREEAAEAQAEKLRQIQEARDQFINEDIYFSYDKATLDAESQDILKRKAQWLRMNSTVSVIIEGHCDERGTTEYNIALGDRRAESAHKFLIYLGIDSSRLTTISYGEERPLYPGNTEEAWSKNRRAHFVIK
ncbi:MAG: peptidoglycan-associated lipoprotein Pal [Desulfobacterales bacterium]|nr:peptidoglycan-associated lipoprotein Pal [Desulfobacterales bacterium]MDD4071634.1 peptidoglycan-associated lipoprotein Pal [Desulfobacterales bacterium]MDD4391634.1 peptidoglycan-associated lipoprotein Pal [Desulfobacterales bacterium]